MLEFVNTMAMVAGYIWFFLLVVAGLQLFLTRNKPKKSPRVMIVKIEPKDHPYLQALQEEFGGKEPEPVQQQSESKITKIE